MKKQILFISGLIIVLIFASCTSEKVVTGNFIQKRKYNKGFFVQRNKKDNKVNKTDNDYAFVNAQSPVVQKNDVIETNHNKISITTPSFELNDEVLLVSNDLQNSIITKNTLSNVNKQGKVLSKKELRKQKQFEKKISKVLDKIEKKSATPSENGKSQTVALILAIFVGVIGIHRMYLGYVGIGIIQLLTLGGCGIWALIDLIRIITGDLKPNGGEYADKF